MLIGPIANPETAKALETMLLCMTCWGCTRYELSANQSESRAVATNGQETIEAPPPPEWIVKQWASELESVNQLTLQIGSLQTLVLVSVSQSDDAATICFDWQTDALLVDEAKLRVEQIMQEDRKRLGATTEKEYVERLTEEFIREIDRAIERGEIKR
jgi:hypothetical protein